MIAMKFRTLTKVLLVFTLGGERQEYIFSKLVYTSYKSVHSTARAAVRQVHTLIYTCVHVHVLLDSNYSTPHLSPTHRQYL